MAPGPAGVGVVVELLVDDVVLELLLDELVRAELEVVFAGAEPPVVEEEGLRAEDRFVPAW